MTIEITSPEVESIIRERMRAGSFLDPQDLLREVLHAPGPTETRTGADLIAAMQACPYPEVDIEPERFPSLAARDVSL